MTEEEQIKAFIAKRGVTKVPAGTGALNHFTAKDWNKVIRTPGGLKAVEAEEEQRLIDERHVTIGHDGRMYVKNGLGERIS
jgi:hypothetical protein